MRGRWRWVVPVTVKTYGAMVNEWFRQVLRACTTADCKGAPTCDMIGGDQFLRGLLAGQTGGVRLSDQQRIDWLRLIRAENVGTFRALINEFGGAARALQRVAVLARRVRRSELRIPSREEAEAEIKAAARIGVRFVAIGEDDYPPRLRETDDAPPLLAVRGRSRVLTQPAVAIVGSRNASAAGSRMAAMLAHDLGEAGFIVVSGLARGIDSAGHRASLATGTVAVLAGGQDKIYPAEHTELAEAIVEDGAAVTEMPMHWEPRARDFPRAIASSPAWRWAWSSSKRRSARAR